eukprot:9344366-Pyramimonas_sp.AAC.1
MGFGCGRSSSCSDNPPEGLLWPRAQADLVWSDQHKGGKGSRGPFKTVADAVAAAMERSTDSIASFAFALVRSGLKIYHRG